MNKYTLNKVFNIDDIPGLNAIQQERRKTLSEASRNFFKSVFVQDPNKRLSY